ncbi:MAG: hypothetical protein DLM60_02405 [Pseudonocardiales bacterium]|nr:MAG: hypothetical protein DLM60_02405 [Pseudonocardiales bacterium]
MGHSFHVDADQLRPQRPGRKQARRGRVVRPGAAAATLAGVLAAGCGAQTPAPAPAPPAPPAVANANGVDMCTILSGPELTALGVQLDTGKQFSQGGVVGCRWRGQSFTLSLERDNATLAGYQAHRQDPKFFNFMDNNVNGRAGAHFGVVPNGSQCAQLIDGGSVSLSVSVVAPANATAQPIEPCAEALRIAQMIEPRLPKAAK